MRCLCGGAVFKNGIRWTKNARYVNRYVKPYTETGQLSRTVNSDSLEKKDHLIPH